MQIQHSAAHGHAHEPGPPPSQRLLWLSDDRVLYAGLLGATSTRVHGAVALYVSLGAPNRISLDGGPWETGDLAVVPPYVPHRVVSGTRMICNVLIEAETVDPERLPPVLRRAGVVEHPALARRVRDAYAGMLDAGRDVDLQRFDFDLELFGERLAPRAVDPRIARVLSEIRRDPSAPLAASDCAASVHLSFSRFLHLFKQEVGASFRSVRAWKRARSLLHHVTRASNLAHIALDVGYPDSAHFSRSIRQAYGLKPKDIFAGSRRLALYRQALACPFGERRPA
jgi:AraC-like DNA-binding protein